MENLFSDRNNIKFMRGMVFDNMLALQFVQLEFNECISRRFKGEEEIRSISKTVNDTCGIDTSETDIACESIRAITLGFIGQIISCNIQMYTVIKDIGYSISDPYNVKITKMNFNDNRNIEFLPNSPSHKFPNLVHYHAERCAIKEISKRNFERLHSLWNILLQGNQIRAVLKDTFQGLTKLSRLDLSKFKNQCFKILPLCF